MRMVQAVRSAQRAPLLQVVKTAVATITAWLLSTWLIPGELPVFAAIAAILVVQPSVNQSFAKAIERSVGVIIGVLIAVALGLLFGDQNWIVIAAIIVALLAAWALRASVGVGNQVAISAVLVLALGASSPNYAVDRILETLIGVTTAMIVNVLIVPPVHLSPARRDLALLGEELATSLDRLAEALMTPCTSARLQEVMLEARLLRPMVAAAETSIATANESLDLNPRRSSHREALREMRALLERFRPMVSQVIGMTRATLDHYDDTLRDEPTIPAIAEQLRRAAHDVRLAVQLAEVVREPEPLTSMHPALTSALVIPTPRSEHWVLIGSLTEDLRRVREELVAPDAENTQTVPIRVRWQHFLRSRRGDL